MKRIGIPGYVNSDGTSFGVGKTYLNFANKFGYPVIIMPHEERADVDMLLLTGGLDVAPQFYGEVPNFYTSNTDVFKQFFLERRLNNYIGVIPILGICLGAQQLNVRFGGRLNQHIIEPMCHPQSPDRRESAHSVKIVNSKFVNEHPEFQMKPFKVNSHHHQGIVSNDYENNLAPDLIPVAVSADKVVEAFVHKDMKIAGIQWHPEEWYDPFSLSMVEYLLS